MTRESITNMIDKRIISSLVDGIAISIIQNELNTRMKNMITTIKSSNKELDMIRLLSMNVYELNSARIRYQVLYIKECSNRIKDLDWLLKNKHKFPKLSNSQVFNLIKLKEKLSEENALPF